jgi:outer membrane protein assembly factor BamB
MWVHTGNPSGTTMEMAMFDHPQVSWETIEPVGWTRLYGLPSPTTPQTTNHMITQTPSVVWKTSVENSSNDFFSQGILVDDIIYTTASNGQLYALDAASGDMLWNVFVGMNPTRPYHVNGSLFIGSHDGLHKVDIQWKSVGTKPFDPIICPPVGQSSKVYIGTVEGDVYALDADSAMVLWHQQFSSETWLEYNEDALVVSSGDTIYRLDPTTGSILWSKLVGGPLTTPATIIDDRIYTGSWDTKFFALDSSTGHIQWSLQTGWGIETEPAIAEQQLIFGSHDGNIYDVEKDSGTQQWFFSCTSGIHQSPVVIDDLVICGSDDGYLYALDKETGTPTWSFSPGRVRTSTSSNYFTTALRSNLIIYQDTVILGACGSFYCIQTK